MKTAKYIWMDGRFKAWKEAKVHIMTHTLHYGGGVFDGARFYKTKNGPAVFRLREHIERFFYSAKAIGLTIPYTAKELEKITLMLLKKNGHKTGYVRFLAYYGYGKMGLNPKGAPTQVAIAAWPFGSYLGHGMVKVKISKYIRIHPKSTVADAKIIGHYSNSILASLEIKAAGYDEALFLDFKGHVAEGPGENVFMVKRGVLYTPTLGSILGGLTREAIMTIARDSGIKVVEKNLKPVDFYNADEMFLTGTAAEITPVASLDDKKIGSGQMGPLTSILKQRFMDIVSGKEVQYKRWLTTIA